MNYLFDLKIYFDYFFILKFKKNNNKTLERFVLWLYIKVTRQLSIIVEYLVGGVGRSDSDIFLSDGSLSKKNQIFIYITLNLS